jgi:CO/xanthine dehydrogenase Mo-binding subunit
LSSCWTWPPEKIGMDPADLRLKNALKTGDVTCNELAVSSLGMIESIEAVREASDWEQKKDPAQRQGHRHGLRVLCLRGGLSHLPLRDLSLGDR